MEIYYFQFTKILVHSHTTNNINVLVLSNLCSNTNTVSLVCSATKLMHNIYYFLESIFFFSKVIEMSQNLGHNIGVINTKQLFSKFNFWLLKNVTVFTQRQTMQLCQICENWRVYIFLHEKNQERFKWPFLKWDLSFVDLSFFFWRNAL